MIIKTKKFQLDKNKYISLAFKMLMREQWWILVIPLLVVACSFLLPGTGWWITGGSVAFVGYILFWLVQFAGVTQMEQGQILFQKLNYEITSQQILIKLNQRQGMPVKWDQIKKAVVTKDAFIISMSKAQLIYLPHRIFNNNNEIKFFDSILKKKGLAK